MLHVINWRTLNNNNNNNFGGIAVYGRVCRKLSLGRSFFFFFLFTSSVLKVRVDAVMKGEKNIYIYITCVDDDDNYRIVEDFKVTSKMMQS